MHRTRYGLLITDALEQVAARGVDPAPQVYARLFAARPELEPLFIMGWDAKGHMLDELFRVVLDHLDAGRYATAFLRSERVNHENLGVPPEVFITFFDHVAGALADVLGPAWTPAHAQAWGSLLQDLTAEI